MSAVCSRSAHRRRAPPDIVIIHFRNWIESTFNSLSSFPGFETDQTPTRTAAAAAVVDMLINSTSFCSLLLRHTTDRSDRFLLRTTILGTGKLFGFILICWESRDPSEETPTASSYLTARRVCVWSLLLFTALWLAEWKLGPFTIKHLF